MCLELKRELHPTHPLHGCTVSALAAHRSTDDVLYLVHGQPNRVAQVHLTWKVEACDKFPWTVLFGSVGEWLSATAEP